MERDYVSRFGRESMGLVILKDGEPTDPDDSLVHVTVTREADEETILTTEADREEEGVYSITLTSASTQTVGFYTILWEYALSGASEVYETYVEVGPSSPAYDALSPDMKALVEAVWRKFSDTFDSMHGGPNLQEYKQAHWGRNRMAQLLETAFAEVNLAAQPHTTYGLHGGKRFPLAKWGGVLEQRLYIESLKHLIRSYTEQPQVMGINVARFDRAQYANAWRSILQDEQREYESKFEIFKMAHMGLGKPSVLVGGGSYGHMAAVRHPKVTPRPRFWARYH